MQPVMLNRVYPNALYVKGWIDQALRDGILKPVDFARLGDLFALQHIARDLHQFAKTLAEGATSDLPAFSMTGLDGFNFLHRIPMKTKVPRMKDLAGAMAAAIFSIFVLWCGPAAALYDIHPTEIPGRPGTLIRVWPIGGGGAGYDQAFRFIYRSTDPRGKTIPVSGAIYIPPGPLPAGGRNVIAWAHPTSGVVPDCAPSLYPERWGLVWNMPELMRKGYILVAPDYPGLGTEGIHPYLIGESEGRAVLDSVRAARNFANSGASNRFAVWGHSQGGHAALFTGQIAKRYAPELKLYGVAAAAPATDLVELFRDDVKTEQSLIAMALLSWATHEKVSPDPIIVASKRKSFDETARGCLTSIQQLGILSKDDKALKSGSFLTIDPSTTHPWLGIMQNNTPGKQRVGAPVFIAQGTADKTVNPQTTKNFAKGLCARGERVLFNSLPGVTHIWAARNSAAATLKWMDDRFEGRPAPTSCQ